MRRVAILDENCYCGGGYSISSKIWWILTFAIDICLSVVLSSCHANSMPKW